MRNNNVKFKIFNFDGIVKSQKVVFPVIPANPGSGPGQAPESSSFHKLSPLTLPLSPANGGEGGGEGEG
jgi:hypothetical protein